VSQVEIKLVKTALLFAYVNCFFVQIERLLEQRNEFIS